MECGGSQRQRFPISSPAQHSLHYHLRFLVHRLQLRSGRRDGKGLLTRQASGKEISGGGEVEAGKGGREMREGQ